jgi:TP901 family phage tail tape measure protein
MGAVEGGDVIWRIMADMRDVNAGMVKAQNEFQKSFGAISQSVGQATTRIGYAVTAAGAAVTGAFTLAAKAAIDWESAFIGVRKTVDATEEQFQELSRGIRDLALEIPVAATELAKFAEIGGQMGVPREQLLAFTKVIAILGETTNIAGEQGAAMLAQFANVAQVPQSQYSNLAAAIVDLGNAGTSTEAEILAMGQRMAAAGSIAGLSAGDILGLANSLVGVGIEAEAGGTALSKVFIDMKNAVMSGGKQLENLAAVAGMSAQQFAAAFNADPAQAIVAFIQGLDNINTAGGNVFTTLDELGYTEIRLRNALLSSAQAADTMAASVRLGNSAFKENNAHNVEAEKRFASTASQLQLLKNEFMEIAMLVGEALIPVLRGMLEAVRPVLMSVIEWIRANPELTAGIAKVAAAIGAMMLVMGPVIVVIGTLIGGLGGIVTAIAAVGAAPFAAIMAAIAAAVGLVITTVIALVYYWDEAKAILTATFNAISSAFWFVFGPIIEQIKWLASTGLGILQSAAGFFGYGGGAAPAALATGGTIQQAGWALVGERGPELVQMPQGATVYDAQQTQAALQGANVSINVNIDGTYDLQDPSMIRQLGQMIARETQFGLRSAGVLI